MTVIVAVGLAVAASDGPDVALPVAASAITAGLGILSTVLVAYRLLDPPVRTSSRKFGVFLGLIAAAGIAYGGWLAMQEEGTSFGDQAGPASAAATPPPPPPARRPPPPGPAA